MVAIAERQLEPTVARYVKDLERLNNADLDDKLRKSYADLADCVRMHAALVVVYDDRGLEMPNYFSNRQIAMLWRIARGEMLPEAFNIQLVSVMEKVARLPIGDQRRYIVEGKPIKLCVFEDGKWTHRNVKLAELTKESASLAIDSDAPAPYIRPVEEQRTILEGKRGRVPVYAKPKVMREGLYSFPLDLYERLEANAKRARKSVEAFLIAHLERTLT